MTGRRVSPDAAGEQLLDTAGPRRKEWYMSYKTNRDEYIAGLRQLADLLEQHNDLPVPTHGHIDWLLFGGDQEYERQKATAATIVRTIPTSFTKSPHKLFGFTTHLGGSDGLELSVVVDRAAVCERVVTGTREVTNTIPDPDAMVDVLLVEVTETVEDVEWRCTPLLADAAVTS